MIGFLPNLSDPPLLHHLEIFRSLPHHRTLISHRQRLFACPHQLISKGTNPKSHYLTSSSTYSNSIQNVRKATLVTHRSTQLTPRARPAVLGVNFGQSYASIAVIDKEGHPLCIANEDGERQIACAISYAGEQVVSKHLLISPIITHADTPQYIGNGAKPHLVKNGKNTIMGFRNLLGHT